jgi:hypothetical protein
VLRELWLEALARHSLIVRPSAGRAPGACATLIP